MSKLTFLPQLGLALLYCRENVVTNGGSGEAVKASTRARNSNNIKVLGTCINEEKTAKLSGFVLVNTGMIK